MITHLPDLLLVKQLLVNFYLYCFVTFEFLCYLGSVFWILVFISLENYL